MSIAMDRSHNVSTDETHHRNKNRKFLWIVLILAGVVILLASLFLLTVIYRTRKSGK
jgi:flagellar basal body-associated protein FliL